MARRQDVSVVPLQGAHVAGRCPVRAQLGVLEPDGPGGEAAALSAVAQRRIERARAHTAAVVAHLVGTAGALDATADAWAEQQARTVDAMEAGTPVIVGGRLPADLGGRRAGGPDILVRAPGGGYRAIAIRSHRALEAKPGGSARCSAQESPSLESAGAAADRVAKHVRGDALLLAHHQRMLEAAGWEATDGRWAGLLGSEGVVVWHDLDEPVWRTPSTSEGRKQRSTMDVYDFEFDFRLDIIAVALAHRADPTVAPLVVPVRTGECETCPWWSHCGVQLGAGSGDVSLLPRTGWQGWRVHRAHGVATRAELASLDHTTAALLAAKVGVTALLDAAAASDPSTPVADVVGSRKRSQLAALRDAGIETLADARRLCPRTASYGDGPATALPELIDQARAALGPAPAYRRRGCTTVAVPAADVEVDVDMESVEAGVYLWGTLLSPGAARAGLDPGYHPHVTWEPLDAAVEDALFAGFWSRLQQVRRAARRRGLTFCAYCYSAGAESGQMRRLAPRTGVAAEVEELIHSEEWVDLRAIVDRQLVTGSSLGLKSVAPLAGFAWGADDAGGAQSMLRYEEATAAGHPAGAAARRWLLSYNRDDVTATAALRGWLRRDGAGLPPIEQLDVGVTGVAEAGP